MQVGRPTVAGHDDLLAVLLEVVEDVEKLVLCSGLSCQFLYVIDDKQVDGLVETYELRTDIGNLGLGILQGKLMRPEVQHATIGEELLGSCANGVDKMCLAHTRRTIDEEGVEGDLLGFFCDAQSHAASKAIGIAFDEVVEALLLI